MGGSNSPGSAEQRRHPGRPGRLDHLLRPLKAEQQAARQRRLRHRHHPVRGRGEDGERDVARPLHRDAVGHRRRAHDLDRVARRQRGDQPGHRRRLHADHADLGVERVHGDRDARREPAAAGRDEDRPHLRALLDDLEPERALACHDVRVVERVDEHRAGPRREQQRLLERVLHRRPVQDHRRAVGAGRLHLRHRRPLGHDHGGRGAEQPGGERDALRVVARARRHHAAGPLRVGQPGDPGVGAAHLERPRALQVLALQVDRAARLLGQHPRVEHRGRRDDVAQQLARRDDVIGLHERGNAKPQQRTLALGRPAARCEHAPSAT